MMRLSKEMMQREVLHLPQALGEGAAAGAEAGAQGQLHQLLRTCRTAFLKCNPYYCSNSRRNSKRIKT